MYASVKINQIPIDAFHAIDKATVDNPNAPIFDFTQTLYPIFDAEQAIDPPMPTVIQGFAWFNHCEVQHQIRALFDKPGLIDVIETVCDSAEGQAALIVVIPMA